jgi:hypothetical protein
MRTTMARRGKRNRVDQTEMEDVSVVDETTVDTVSPSVVEETVAPEVTVVAIKNNLTQVVTVSYWKGGTPLDVTIKPRGSVVCDPEVFESTHYKDLAIAGMVTQIQLPRKGNESCQA